MAFLSAVMYGAYAVVMKKRVGNEDRVNMPLFFGFVGLFNLVFLWPGFFVLHFTGVETFEIPPTRKIWTVVLVCSYKASARLYFSNTETAKLCHIFCERLLLGVRNASHDTSYCVCWFIFNDTFVAHRSNHPQLAVSQFAVLGGGSSRGAFIPLHQP